MSAVRKQGPSEGTDRLAQFWARRRGEYTVPSPIHEEEQQKEEQDRQKKVNPKEKGEEIEEEEKQRRNDRVIPPSSIRQPTNSYRDSKRVVMKRKIINHHHSNPTTTLDSRKRSRHDLSIDDTHDEDNNNNDDPPRFGRYHTNGTNNTILQTPMQSSRRRHDRLPASISSQSRSSVNVSRYRGGPPPPSSSSKDVVMLNTSDHRQYKNSGRGVSRKVGGRQARDSFTMSMLEEARMKLTLKTEECKRLSDKLGGMSDNMRSLEEELNDRTEECSRLRMELDQSRSDVKTQKELLSAVADYCRSLGVDLFCDINNDAFVDDTRPGTGMLLMMPHVKNASVKVNEKDEECDLMRERMQQSMNGIVQSTRMGSEMRQSLRQKIERIKQEAWFDEYYNE